MNAPGKVTRRSLLAAGALSAAAVVVGFRFERPARAKSPSPSEAAFQPNAFLRITPDGRITAIIGPCEMGQGVYTALAMVLADELEADWQSIAVEAAPVNPVYGNPFFEGIQATAASTSVAVFYDTTRQAGAAARTILVDAASQIWRVPADKCYASNGRVAGPSGQSLSFGELVAVAARLKLPSKEAVKLKDPKDFKLIGRSKPRLEGPQIVVGRLPYGIDMDLPQMLTAVVARAPTATAKLKSYQRRRAERIAGVRAVVEIPSGVAVIAEHYWAALRGRELLEVEWDLGSAAALSSDGLNEQFSRLARTPGPIAADKGDAVGLQARARDSVTAEYSVPYLAHAPMEPLNCTIQTSADGGCDVWVGTQYPSLDRKVVARILDLPPEKVRVNTLYMGGAFGRRGSPTEDVVVETAYLIKAARTMNLNVPIRNIWPREAGIRGGFYRPMAVNRLQATLGANGLPETWLHRIVAQSPMRLTEFEFLITQGIDSTSVAGAKDLPYVISNLRVELQTPDTGPTVQWMRSVGNSNTCFAIECFLDELAAIAKVDPVEYRRRLLKSVKENARLLNVLDLAAEKAGWGDPLPKGRARGVAIQDYWGTKIAQVAEVSVEAGHVRVHRVTCAVDCGFVVNPDGVRAQMEGGIIFGLSAALYGQITLANGQTEQSNFDTYPIVRLDASPQIDVHIVPSNEAPGGIGESATPHIAPAVCNAIFAASGRRIRNLPVVARGLTA